MDTSKNQHTEYLENYDAYSDELFGYVLIRVRNRDVALDIVQETFLRTWEYLQRSSIDNIRAFLYRVAYNLIVDGSRRKRATYSVDELILEGIELRGETDQFSLRDQVDSQLAVELLDKLPENYREILTLRFVQDLEIHEIATLLGERPNSISVKVHRGIQKLRDILEKAQTDYENKSE